MSNLVTRAISGAVFVAVLSISLYLGSWYWLGLLTLLFALSIHEYINANKELNLASLERINIISLFSIWFSASIFGHYYFLDYFTNLGTMAISLPAGYIIAILLSIPVIIIGCYFEIRKGKEAQFIHLQYTLFGFFFLGLGFLSLGFLRHNALMNSIKTDHLIIAFASVAGVWVSDTFAYLTGQFLGKTKLAPSISPNKTIEGFIGGLIFTMLFTWLFLCVFNSECSGYIALIYGALLSSIATLGDLVQSLWKRNLGIKDSGSFIPGHGGILDRIDAQMLAAPFSLFFWVLINNVFI